ncbi:MAG: VanZ family protein [Lachnospiraceae bacterium]
MDLIEVWNVQKPHWSPEAYTLFYTLVGISFFVMMVVVTIKGYSKSKSVALFLLITYLVLVYASTVFSREPGISMAEFEGMSIPQFTGPNYQIEPFWTLRWGIKAYGEAFIWECILNVFMLMPVGFLFPFLLRHKKYSVIFILTYGVGFVISLSIELLQLFLQRGLCEFDDLFYNTIGVIISCLLWILFRKVWKLYERKMDKN